MNEIHSLEVPLVSRNFVIVLSVRGADEVLQKALMDAMDSTTMSMLGKHKMAWRSPAIKKLVAKTTWSTVFKRNDNLKVLGKIVEERRSEMGLCGEELAYMLDVDPIWVSNFEKGRVRREEITEELLENLCITLNLDALGVFVLANLDDLVTQSGIEVSVVLDEVAKEEIRESVISTVLD